MSLTADWQQQVKREGKPAWCPKQAGKPYLSGIHSCELKHAGFCSLVSQEFMSSRNYRTLLLKVVLVFWWLQWELWNLLMLDCQSLTQQKLDTKNPWTWGDWNQLILKSVEWWQQLRICIEIFKLLGCGIKSGKELELMKIVTTCFLWNNFPESFCLSAGMSTSSCT